MFRCIRIKPIHAIAVLICFSLMFLSSFSAPAAKATLSSKEGVFLPVIMYHSVMPDDFRTGDYVISSAMLESDLAYLSENGYTAILPSDLEDYVYDDIPLPEKPIMLTFDDGFYNNFSEALPLLEKYDMCAVISVVGEYIVKSEAEGESNPRYSYCTCEQLSELVRSGRIEIGSHTYNLHSISSYQRGCMKRSGESNEEYEKRFRSDILQLEELLCENAGLSPTAFAYPFGFISRESIPILKSMGYKVTFSCEEKPNYITKDEDTLYGICRYNRSGNYSTEDFMKKILSE